MDHTEEAFRGSVGGYVYPVLVGRAEGATVGAVGAGVGLEVGLALPLPTLNMF